MGVEPTVRAWKALDPPRATAALVELVEGLVGCGRGNRPLDLSVMSRALCLTELSRYIGRYRLAAPDARSTRELSVSSRTNRVPPSIINFLMRASLVVAWSGPGSCRSCREAEVR